MAAGKSEHPVRVIIDSRARIPVTASVFHKGDGQKVIAVSAKADVKKISALEPLATIITAGSDTVDLAVVLDRLYGMGIRRLMVEGGGTLIASLFACGLVDEFSVFIGNIIIGGKDAPTPADGAGWIRENDFSKLTLISAERMENGVLLHWRVGS
jgi:2,5-diamino-6-(ribosylamino)-4(3H)-pyrimidinone 5'-phosphate reductase